MPPESRHRYALPARLLHWLVAIGVMVQIGLGWASEWTEDRHASFQLIRNHYQLGVILAGLMAMRLLWRVAKGAPPPEEGEPRWRRTSATAVHWALYALLLTMPVSGYVIWIWMDAPRDVLGLFELPALFTPPTEDETWRANAWYIHVYSSWAVIALVLLHVAAALWHELVLRDRLIRRRML